MAKNTNKKGFTLVELVIVIAVIAILAGVMIATFSNVVSDAQASADLQEVKSSVDAMYLSYVADNGDVPNALEVKDGAFDGFVVVPSVGLKDITADDIKDVPRTTENPIKKTIYFTKKGVATTAPADAATFDGYTVVIKYHVTVTGEGENIKREPSLVSVEYTLGEKTYATSAKIVGKNGTEFTIALITDENSINYGSYTITENK